VAAVEQIVVGTVLALMAIGLRHFGRAVADRLPEGAGKGWGTFVVSGYAALGGAALVVVHPALSGLGSAVALLGCIGGGVGLARMFLDTH